MSALTIRVTNPMLVLSVSDATINANSHARGYEQSYLKHLKHPRNLLCRSGEGITHQHYTGTPLWRFGDGMGYADLNLTWGPRPHQDRIALADLLSGAAGSLQVRVQNIGSTVSVLRGFPAVVLTRSHTAGLERRQRACFCFCRRCPGVPSTKTVRIRPHRRSRTWCIPTRVDPSARG